MPYWALKLQKKADIYCIGVPTYIEPSELNGADIVVGDHKKLMEHLLSLESLPNSGFSAGHSNKNTAEAFHDH